MTKKVIIEITYQTNESYPYWKEVKKELIVNYEDSNNSYYIEEEIKKQYGLNKGEYIVELRWNYTNARIIKEKEVK